jgi:hypothetical protein
MRFAAPVCVTVVSAIISSLPAELQLVFCCADTHMSDIFTARMAQPDEENQLSGLKEPLPQDGCSLSGAADVGPLPNGYAKLSTLMSKVPLLAMFRRFGDLNALSLLYIKPN